MLTTVPADNIASPRLAYVFVAQPSVALQQEIARLLKVLAKELPGVIWTMPLGTLHFTLYAIIQPKDYLEDKQRMYGRHRYQYENIPADIFSSFAPIQVHLTTIAASSHAVIVKGQDDGSFEMIRHQLITRLPILAESRLPPTIIHSSIARYVKIANLAQVEAVIQQQSIDFTETITEFKLLKNRIFPFLEYDTIRTYKLGSSHYSGNRLPSVSRSDHSVLSAVA